MTSSVRSRSEVSVIIITFSDSGVKVEIERVDRRMMSADDDCRLGRAGPCM